MCSAPVSQEAELSLSVLQRAAGLSPRALQRWVVGRGVQLLRESGGSQCPDPSHLETRPALWQLEYAGHMRPGMTVCSQPWVLLCLELGLFELSLVDCRHHLLSGVHLRGVRGSPAPAVQSV